MGVRTSAVCMRITFVLLAVSSPALADGDAYEPSALECPSGGRPACGGSSFRLYAGPILWVPFYANNFDIFAVGGTVAFQYYPDRRVFFVGGRLAFLGDPQGIGAGYVGGFADAEVGIRPRLAESRKGAFAVVLSGGVGGLLISGPFWGQVQTTGFVHLSVHAGLGFDIGVFTMDALGGLTMLATGDGATGAVEALVEGGIRF